jgi:hypothetical protein
MIGLKTIAVAATIAGAIGLTALEMGPGVSNAAPSSPVTSGTPWARGPGPDPGPGHGDWHGGPGWGKGPWHGGPGFLGPIDACIAATGPYGNVTGYVCI